MLPKLSREEILELQAKSIAAKKQKAEERKANAHLYKTEYLDSSYWEGLFKKHNIRQPNRLEPCTLKGMRKYLKKLNISAESFVEETGISKLQGWMDLNSKHTLFGFVGNLLELKESFK